MDAQEFYEQRIGEISENLAKLKQKKRVFGIMRLGSMFAIVAAFYFLWSLGWIYVLLAVLLLIIVFVQLVFRDISNKNAIRHQELLININRNELKALDADYFHFENGAAFLPKEHYYASDMDVFGHASLYQFMNRTSSEQGASTLAAWLLTGAPIAVIASRQKAVQELQKKAVWRQELQAIGNETAIKQHTQQQMESWMQEPNRFLQFAAWKWLRFLLPAFMLGITVACIFGKLSMGYFYGGLLLMGIIAYQINKVIAPIHNQLSRMVDELNILSLSTMHIENEKFDAPLLQALQNDLSENNQPASARIRQIKKILERLDIRYNIVVSFPLNLFLLWNLHQVLDLEKWKLQQQQGLNKWFDVLASMEALNSVACLHFNNSAWVMPEFSQQHFSIEAEGMGHPLIPASKRIANPISIKHKGELMLITGSNMAGKSTYLRSVGINVILAMAGAPVCAKSFTLSPVQLMSSMRIADNLEESTSTFYAELKKLQTIIEKVNAGEKIFILLDEILRGTNSHDRHTGSEALIKQLIRKDAAAILATHDLALADIKEQFPQKILNHHFDVQVNDDELYFDYKLKPGICSSMNASILMRKVGIEL